MFYTPEIRLFESVRADVIQPARLAAPGFDVICTPPAANQDTAAISNVGLNNMLRFENTPDGSNNTTKFGAVKNLVALTAPYEMDAMLSTEDKPVTRDFANGFALEL